MKKALAVVTSLFLAGSAYAQDPAPSPPEVSAPAVTTLKAATGPDLGEAAAGEVIYLRYCAACHGQSMKGDGPVASGLVKKPIDLTQISKENAGVFPLEKVMASIDGRKTTRMHGSPDMPVWGEIFALTTGTDAPSAELAVKRIAHYLWTGQEKRAVAENK